MVFEMNCGLWAESADFFWLVISVIIGPFSDLLLCSVVQFISSRKGVGTGVRLYKLIAILLIGLRQNIFSAKLCATDQLHIGCHRLFTPWRNISGESGN